MKISMDVEATPEELRRFFGLPDVQPLHADMVESVRKGMREGWEGYDPAALMASLMQPGAPAMEALQKTFWEAFRQGSAGGKGGEDSPRK